MLAVSGDERGPDQGEKYKGLQYIVLGTEVAFTVAGAAWMGWLLDGWLGTSPWLLLVSILAGGASSLWMLLRLAARLSRQEDEKGR